MTGSIAERLRSAANERQRNLILLPLFIAMTALSRLIILQGKETDAVVLYTRVAPSC